MTPQAKLTEELDECLEFMGFLSADMLVVLDFDDFDIHNSDSIKQIKKAKTLTNQTYSILKQMEKLSNELKLFGVI